jgi:GNAT superfamily N-acetyltransferase
VLLVAESSRGKTDLGVCLTGPFEDPLIGARVPMVLLLFVSPDVRHRGLAHAMVEEVSRLLMERGHRTLAARAGHNDDALISMGERWGFVRQWEMMLRE